MSLIEMLAKIPDLSVEERYELIDAIFETLAVEPEDGEMPQSHRDELDRRLALHQDDPRAGSPWEEVKARLLGHSGSAS